MQKLIHYRGQIAPKKEQLVSFITSFTLSILQTVWDNNMNRWELQDKVESVQLYPQIGSMQCTK